jgi:TRAP-type mannitol/chloroaromatic compound transport system permease small subunit
VAPRPIPRTRDGRAAPYLIRSLCIDSAPRGIAGDEPVGGVKGHDVSNPMSQRSIARSVGTTLAGFERVVNRVTSRMAVFSGFLFLVLAIFMTVDVSSRQLGGPFTGIADTIASFVLALGGTWSLAFALSSGTHVRIDVLTPLYSARMNRILRLWGLLMVLVLAGVLAFKAWQLVAHSYLINALVPQSMLAIPLYIPQAFLAIGFTVLVVQATAMFILGVAQVFDHSPGPDRENGSRGGDGPHAGATGGEEHR